MALSLISLGEAYHRMGRSEEALPPLRRGLQIVRDELLSGQGLSIAKILPFLRAAYAMAEDDPGQRQALYREMFGAPPEGSEGSHD